MAHKIDRKANAIMSLLKGIAFFFKEIGYFYRFFWETPKAEREVVFYSEREDYYPYFEGIIEKLIGKHKQIICYVTSDPNDSIFKKSELKIKTFYLDKLLPLFMKFVDCKVFVMTLTDLNLFHLKRSIEPVHYVYVFHSLSSTHMTYRYKAFDHYDSILCCGPHQVKEIRIHEKLNKLHPKKLVEAGYYRLERIYEAYQRHPTRKLLSDAKKTVLIAPSWGKSNILEVCGEKLINVLLDSDYKVIVRPHPETVIHKPHLIKLFTAKFCKNPDFTFETSVATDNSFLKADVLITDFSGTALEYALGTERPVVFIDVPLKVLNPKYKELGIEALQTSVRSEIGIVVQLDKIDAIPKITSELIANHESYKTKLAELRNRYVYSFGHSSEIGAKHIMDILGTNHEQP